LERVSIPGFIRARRYSAIRSDRRYFTLYETETVGVLNGSDYLARLNNPTPWTRRCIPLFRNNKRTACRVIQSLGHGLGGVMGTLDLSPVPGREAELRRWLTTTALPAMAPAPGVVGVHLCEADLEVTRVRAEEKKLLDRPDDLARWVILVEGAEVSAVDSACGVQLAAETLARHGAEPRAVTGNYRLDVALVHEA